MGALPPRYMDAQPNGDGIAEAISLRDNDRTPVQADYDDEIVVRRVALRQRLPTMHRGRAKSF